MTIYRSARAQEIQSFKVMDLLKRAQELADSGRDIIHLGAGEPDFGAAPAVIEAAKRALDTVPLGYTPAGGIWTLREKIAQFYQQRYQCSISAEQVLVTAGASAGLMLAFGLVAEPGRHFLMADPGYPCNRQFLRFIEAGAKLVAVDHRHNYQLDAELIAQHWDDQVSGALVASPANPTGSVLHEAELRGISAAIRERGGSLIVDEIYHGLTYAEAPPTAISIDPEAIVLNSFSKYFAMTGWRLGWVLSSAEAISEMEKMAQNLYISPPTLSQHAALTAFEPESIALFDARREELRVRRDLMVDGLKQLGFKIPLLPEGAFYVYADASDLTDDSFAWCWRLLDEAGVVATPGADFGSYRANQFVRFAYTNSQQNISRALARIADFIAAA